jgi:hypothetical protein
MHHMVGGMDPAGGSLGRSFAMTRLGFMRLLLGSALVGLMALTCGSASAIHPTLVRIKKNKDGSRTFFYEITVDKGVSVSGKDKAPGPDFFTIYNFYGLVKDSAKSPRDWKVTTQDDGITPLRGGKALINPVDTKDVPNVTWSYTGSKSLRGGGTIRGFSVRTTAKGSTTGEYGAQVTRTLPPHTPKGRPRGTKEARIGKVITPALKEEMKEDKKDKKDGKNGDGKKDEKKGKDKKTNQDDNE